jgi:ring-1,2-phenylacetyl-CoA epoxidase subunit PaaC
VTLSAGARDVLLALADDEHLVGARHTSWIGMAPFLEEDLAFCSIAQDELGHALALYELLVDDPADIDRFALLREPAAYRSCWLAEAECADWADALVRHWLYDRAEALRWAVLARCPDERVAAVAARARREEAFHLAHADRLLTDVTRSSGRAPIVAAVERLVPLAHGVWDAPAGEAAALAEGFVDTSAADLAVRWRREIGRDLAGWGLDPAVVDEPAPESGPAATQIAAIVARQSRRTVRSPAFAALASELQAVVSIDPTAVW